ncbi:hypothetical protein VI34_06005 [Methylophilales bacterium MBRSG12]|uniref:Uncharacterized protein n=1 Tax=Methylophilales bacterium MBRS-H7 TaxID=1623450 RepID=A0A0H4J382_9PROT|nr:hypothetical protein UZ34_04320 [Methylophilales bacterium MBRSF5]AKO66223.1 hypothetical protein VI33_06010 [Methylophilales bacterium MBRS-H7]AKO67541.1 hypothetical protein VI34_06005 [Methylophilales bacterium MBRSG12]
MIKTYLKDLRKLLFVIVLLITLYFWLSPTQDCIRKGEEFKSFDVWKDGLSTKEKKFIEDSWASNLYDKEKTNWERVIAKQCRTNNSW